MKYQEAIAARKERKEREKVEKIGCRACEYRLGEVTYSDFCIKTYAYVLSGESIKVDTNILPPKGFRLMAGGEQIKEGDLYFGTSGKWEPVPGPIIGYNCPISFRQDRVRVQYATPQVAKHRFRSIDDPGDYNDTSHSSD